MNRLKSIFITVFVSLTFLISLSSIYYAFFYTEFDLAWLFLAFSNLFVVGYFANIYLKPISGNSKELIGLTIAILVSGLISFLLNGITNYNVQQLNVLWIIPFAGWLLYVYWYSILDFPAGILKEGDILPVFDARDVDGNIISSSKWKNKKTLFLFYRGNWCPFCKAQIKQLIDKYGRLNELGIALVFVSPQPQKYSRKLVEKYNLDAFFLVDTQNVIANKFGINHDNGVPFGMELFGFESDTVTPTIVIADHIGKIIYIDIAKNYRRRPAPEEFLSLFKESF